MNNGHPFDKRSARVSPLDSLKGRAGKGGKTKRDIEGFEWKRERERERGIEGKKRRKGKKEHRNEKERGSGGIIYRGKGRS